MIIVLMMISRRFLDCLVLAVVVLHSRLVLAQEANLCLGRPVTASGATYGGQPASNLTDGNRQTFSHPLAGSATLGFYYQIDMGEAKNLSRLVLYNRSGCCPERLSRYRVTLFADQGGTPGAVNWSADLRVNGTFSPDGGADTVTADLGAGASFSGRFVRIENRGNQGYSPQIAEVEAWPAPVPIIRRFESDAGNLTRIGRPGYPTSATVRWHVENFSSLSLSPGVAIPTEPSGSVLVTPETTTTYTLTATNAAGISTATVAVGVDEPELKPSISEFMAAPIGGYVDEDGDSQDWIEIRNPNVFSLNLAGYFLTDDSLRLAQWEIPSVSVPAGGYLVVFASGKDRRDAGSPLHTNFSLKSAGEYLALVARNGTTVIDQFPADHPTIPQYPPQSEGLSYGLDENGKLRYFSPATPGAVNGTGYLGGVEDTTFSVDRGFYDTPQTVTITSATADAIIRYTLGSAVPTATSGMVYQEPLTISTTTVLRAAAFKEGFAPSNVDTQTYIFPQQVKSSSVLRTAITQHATYGPQVIDALKDLPSFSLVTPHSIPNGTDVAASIEFIVPGGAAGSGFQENCGVELYGGAFTEFAKKNFRLNFRQQYGVGRLRHPLFAGYERGTTPVESFDALELRGGSHDMVERGFYLSNLFTDSVMLDMGQLNPHGRWAHLYLNGTYWGVFHLRERWDADMQSDYLGGRPEDYESINGNWNVGGWAEPGDPYDGDGSSWTRIKSLRSSYTEVMPYLDAPHFIDYMLTFMFGDCEDEYRCSGPIGVGSGFKWFLNDADGWLRTSAGNNTVRGAPGRLRGDGPGSLFSMLFKEGNSDYRLLLADRIQRHFFNGGALTQSRNVARLNELSNALQRPFIVESARWNYRSPESWLSAKNQILNSWFATRTNTVLSQLRTAGFFPSLPAPVFSQRGGVAADGTRITMTAPSGTIYYTDDGSDPRLPGGAIAPRARPVSTGAVTESTVPVGSRWRWFSDAAGLGASDVVAGHAAYDPSNWKHPDFDDSAWSEGAAELGYGEADEASVLPYGDPVDRFRTAYFRRSFTLPVVPGVTAATLKLKRDDGAIVYLNGIERARDGLTGVVAGDGLATSAADDGKSFLSFVIPAGALVGGKNTLAVELHQSAPNSGDASFDAELILTRTSGGDAGVLVTANTLLRARTYNAGQWSAIDENFLQVGSAAVAAGDLAVSELHFHPLGGTETEFIELENVSARAINLRGCRFTQGIDFVFPDNRDSLLAPAQRLLLVEDIFRFQQKYGITIPIAGRYFGSLANEGEALTLVSPDATTLVQINYDDAAPWPASADGGGFTMVRRPDTSDPSQPAAWRASAVANGTPGGSDATTFAGSPGVDADGDQLSALVEYALGTSDASGAEGMGSIGTSLSDQGHLLISFPRNLRADDVAVRIETTTDLGPWTPPPVAPVLISQVQNGQGTATETWSVGAPTSSRVFVRLHITQR